ncbi:hypothetical protein HZA96_00345 [Candidatus Woesearchaeota archaeon]|nr:hypothetical protein [Candidatus Woesearchaeota archaeon]
MEETTNIEKKVEKKEEKSLDTNISKEAGKTLEIKMPQECKLFADYQDPICDDYLLDMCNKIKEKRQIFDLWNQRDKGIHNWM